MEKQYIIITLKPSGEMELKTEGFYGEECLILSKDLLPEVPKSHVKEKITEDFFKRKPENPNKIRLKK